MMAVVVSLVAPGPIQADWELQTVDSAITAVALALDGDGIAHLCYFTPPVDHLSGTTSHLLKYANNAGGPGFARATPGEQPVGGTWGTHARRMRH